MERHLSRLLLANFRVTLPHMHEITKVPLSMPAPSPMFPTEPQLTRLVDQAVNGKVGNSKASATTITSGSSGYDGTKDPGKPGEPV